jgi:hypothetical protein
MPRSLILIPMHVAFFCLAMSALSLTVLAVLSLDQQPLIQLNQQQPPESGIAGLKQILESSDLLYNPEKPERTLIATEKELNAAANYLLRRTLGNGAAHVALLNNASQLTVSIPLPPNPIGSFANVRLRLHEENGFPIIGRFTIGRLTIAPEYAAWLIKMMVKHSPPAQSFGLADIRIKSLRITPDNLFITYTGNHQPLLDHQTIAGVTTNELLSIYQKKLAAITRRPDLKKRISLSALLQPLVQFARSRSNQGHPIDENRALLLTLNDYINGNALGRLLPSPIDTPDPTRHTVVLNGRGDLAQHFIASATMAATGHDTLADLIGLYKETSDAENGSGFSFTDLAANQAGIRFGTMAVNSTVEARKLQDIVSQNPHESVYMPNVRSLPENLSSTEFEQRFGGDNSFAYQQIMKEIKHRIAACPLYDQRLGMNEESTDR